MGIAQRSFYNRFNKITNNKDEKKVIFDLWVYCYDQLRQKIWLKRCEEVVEIERKRGIGKKDKRSRHESKKKTKTEENNEKNKKETKNLIKLVTEQKMMNSIIDNRPIGLIWHGFMNS